MQYDFDAPIDRRKTNDIKWRPDGLAQFYPIQVSDRMIPMWIADMDLPSPQCVTAAFRKRLQTGLYGYCLRGADYFPAVQWWYEQRHGLALKEEWLSTAPGIVTAINMAIRAFTLPGDGVILQQPVYEPFSTLISKTGRTLVNNALRLQDGRYTMDLGLLDAQAADPNNKLMILCSPHNPVGRVWTREELAAVAEICKRHGVVVVSDEIHSDIVYAPHRHIPFTAVSDGPHILCTSPAKTFNVPGIIVSNIFIPDPELKKQYDKTADSFSVANINTFGYEVVPAAYSHGGAEWLEQLLPYLAGNIDEVERWAAGRGIPFARPEGSFLCWLDLTALGMNDQSVMERIVVAQEVICVPGFMFGPGGEGHLRLNIGCTRSTLREALARIEKGLP